ncbi:MAG: hypothetical protein KKF78_02140, partial [Candidatus Omnitrophica bacterium]|nr:hypothetical protein [Candidatus Omnitrophota bacterium]MBU1995937.1 hypothetical protein [Candidatus Omnitrophota bacterium]
IREKYENIYREDPTLKLYLAEENIIEKNWSNVLYFVGKTFMKLKLYEESLEYFNKTIEQDKDNYLPYLGIALINFELGNKDNARKYIGMAENLSDNDEINIYKEILGL